MSAFRVLNALTDFKNEIFDNLETKTGWGRNQLKEMIETVFERQRKVLEEEEE